MRYSSNCTKSGDDCLKCYIKHKCLNYNPNPNADSGLMVGDKVEVLNNKYRTHLQCSDNAPSAGSQGIVKDIKRMSTYRQHPKFLITVAMTYNPNYTRLLHHKALVKIVP